MNSYNIDDLVIANLIDGTESGLKNIIGIPIYVNDNCYFYSILDDCFFRGKICKIFRIEEELNPKAIGKPSFDKSIKYIIYL